MTGPGTLIHPQIEREKVSLLARSIRMHLGLTQPPPVPMATVINLKGRRAGMSYALRGIAAEHAARHRCFVHIMKSREIGKTEAQLRLPPAIAVWRGRCEEGYVA